jgi:hypothetical protein
MRSICNVAARMGQIGMTGFRLSKRSRRHWMRRVNLGWKPWNSSTVSFELRFVGAPFEKLAWGFLHQFYCGASCLT